MKTIVAIALMVLFIFVLVVEWRAYHPSAAPASASQIYIHGTAVCVFRQGESIVARVGECGTGDTPLGTAPGDRFPEFDESEPGLPPGHPPVGPDRFPQGGGRRLLI